MTPQGTKEILGEVMVPPPLPALLWEYRRGNTIFSALQPGLQGTWAGPGTGVSLVSWVGVREPLYRQRLCVAGSL